MYKFSVINNIDQVLPPISSKEEFFVGKKDGYQVVNYSVNFADTFPDVTDESSAILRECRGIIFDELGIIIRRPLHKFFNLGEKSECTVDNINFNKPHHIVTKLDGSMISPFMVNGRMIWGTKMGETFLTPLVEKFLEDNPNYVQFAKTWIENGYTPTFEFCTNKNRIVLPYSTDKLALLAIRNMVTGEYLEYEYQKKLCQDAGIDCVTCLSVDQFNDDMLSKIRSMENVEGYVIRFSDGHMVKVKCDWYCLMHKTKEYLTRERYLTEIIIQDRHDDLKPILFGETAAHFDQFSDSVLRTISDKATFLLAVVKDCQSINLTPKQYALEHSNNFERWINPFVFKHLSNLDVDHQTCLEYIKDYVLKNVGKDKDYNLIKSTVLFGTLDWNEITSNE